MREWLARLIDWFRRDALDRELAEEVRFHREHLERDARAAGASSEESTWWARTKLGNVTRYREAARDRWSWPWLDHLLQDCRYALRALRRSPAFTATVVSTLALGIGASTAMFTVVNAVLLRPLPIPQPESVVYVGWAWSENDHVAALTDLQYEFVRDHNRSFEAVAAYRPREAHLGDEGAAQPVRGLHVSSGFFRAIGFSPSLGRPFDARELAPGGPAVVILGDGVWRTRYGGDAGIIDRQIRLDGEAHTVVGVLPPDFRFPPAALNTGFLVPYVIEATPSDRGNNTDVIGRLRPGTSAATRAAEMRALSSAFHAAYPSVTKERESFRLFTHGDVHVGGATRHTLWLLFGAVSLVLLIACANTATLLLVRASARQREIAVRASIGAGPLRIARLLLTEGLVLSVTAATFGVVFSTIAVRSFLAVAPTALPAGADPGIDGRVLGYAMVVSIVTGLAFGLAAAVPAYRTPLQSVLAGGAGVPPGSARIRETLVFIQTAVAVVLLSGAALLAASFARLIGVDPGFDADRVIAARLGRLPPEYDPARRDLLVDRLLERVRALPGVEHAAAAPSLPLERGMNFPVDVAESPVRGMGAVELRFVSPDYLETLGIPLLGGRDFDERDVEGAEPVAIVNEAFARRFWDDASPLGRTIQVGHLEDRWVVPPGGRHQTRVIGVAADIHELGLDRAPKPTVLLVRAQANQGTPLLLVRGTPSGLLNTVRGEVVAEEPQLAPVVERLSSVVSRSVAAPRFRTLLVGAFAGFALLLAGIGIYGVIATVVQQRRRELGIRLALGASRADVARAVVRRCLASVAAGTVVGLAVFWAVRRVLASWLYDIAPGDQRVLAVTVAVVALVAATASWIPARRATHIDPATALRLD